MAVTAISTSSSSDPHTMKCMEVWGGNQAVDNGVVMAGLDAWLYSRPFGDQSAGGDIHYVSSCACGLISRALVADVSGHGEAVADSARKLRSLMRRYSNFVDQTRFVQGLNDEFSNIAHAGGFATAVVLTYHVPDDKLSVCNAGHPRPLWYSARARSWSLITEPTTPGAAKCGAKHAPAYSPATDAGPSNVPLGIVESICYNQFNIKLGKGDMVVLYTDSLIEAKDKGGTMHGEEGLLRIVQGLDTSDPSEFLHALLSAIGPAQEGDDMTVLILRANGLKPKVSAAMHFKALRLMMKAGVASLFRGEPFPWPEQVATLLSRLSRKRRVAKT
jgi:serine phosphatase RsbU (regulator of sigma subunit)